MAHGTNVNGVWREQTKGYTNVNGVYRNVKMPYSMVAGVWRGKSYIPPIPSSFSYHQGYLSGNSGVSGTFSAPTEGWYRVWVIGRSAGGQTNVGDLGGGGGGGSGAICSSLFYLKPSETINYVSNLEYSQVICQGETARATAGQMGALSTSGYGGAGGAGGVATGGNNTNENGYAGGAGGFGATDVLGTTDNFKGRQGGNGGMAGGPAGPRDGTTYGDIGGGGGGGAKLPNVHCPYVTTKSGNQSSPQYVPEWGRAASGGSSINFGTPTQATRLPNLELGPNIEFYGGGGARGGGSGLRQTPGQSSLGHDGAIIIEKG